jgi:hypothetical protein
MTDEIDDSKLAAILQHARQLPKTIDPPADAWDAIKAQIEKPSIDTGDVVSARRIAVWQRPGFLVAAGLLLVATSSLITVAALSRRAGSPQRAVAPPAMVQASGSGPSTLAQFSVVETGYISTANQLSSILEAGKTTLSPETVGKLRKSLAILDAAIAEARSALAADPANRALIDMLDASYNQKLDLLRRTTEMGRS